MFRAIERLRGRRVVLASASPRRKEILEKLVGWVSVRHCLLSRSALAPLLD